MCSVAVMFSFPFLGKKDHSLEVSHACNLETGFLLTALFLCSVMNLLAEIYSQEEMIPKIFEALSLNENPEFDLNELGRIDDAREGIISQENPFMLSTLAPRLWPFMRHSITSVRYSAIRTLVNLFWLCYCCVCTVVQVFVLYKVYLTIIFPY